MKLGIYKHYKNGDLYTVSAVARHSETGENLVVYQSHKTISELLDEYGPNPVFVRPVDEFTGFVDVCGKLEPRFSWVSEA